MRVAVVTGAACLLLGGLIGVVAMRAGWFDRRNSVGAEEMAEIVKMKSDAEKLALDGNLDAAHAKYRELEQRLVGRNIKDPLFWDILERTKVDKDRIYTILLDKAQSQFPPEKVMPTPGPGKAIRKDDPWYYRVTNPNNTAYSTSKRTVTTWPWPSSPSRRPKRTSETARPASSSGA